MSRDGEMRDDSQQAVEPNDIRTMDFFSRPTRDGEEDRVLAVVDTVLRPHWDQAQGPILPDSDGTAGPSREKAGKLSLPAIQRMASCGRPCARAVWYIEGSVMSKLRFSAIPVRSKSRSELPVAIHLDLITCTKVLLRRNESCRSDKSDRAGAGEIHDDRSGLQPSKARPEARLTTNGSRRRIQFPQKLDEGS